MNANNEIAQLNDRLKELKNVYTGQLLALINKLERNDVDITTRLAKLQESSGIHEKDILEVKNMMQNKLEVILGIQAAVQSAQESYSTNISVGLSEVHLLIKEKHNDVKTVVNNARVGLYKDLDLLMKELTGDIQVISNGLDVKHAVLNGDIELIKKNVCHISSTMSIWMDSLNTQEKVIKESLDYTKEVKCYVVSLTAKQSLLKATVEEELQILTKDMGASHKQLLQVQEKILERQNQLSLMCFCLLMLFFAMGCFYVLSS